VTTAPPPRRTRRAFTLIELIVVVVIIAILAAVAAVAYNQYAAKARSNSVLASASSLRTAVMAASARDDQAPAAEVDALWSAAGGDNAAFLRSLSATYDGPVTYTAAAGDAPATLRVGGAASGTHAACLTLPDSVSTPVTLASGACSGAAAPVAAPCTSPAPAPLTGCTPIGSASAVTVQNGSSAAGAIDGNVNTYWDSNQTDGQWQVTWTTPATFDTVQLITSNTAVGNQTYDVYGQVDGAWTATPIGTTTLQQPANSPAGQNEVQISVTAGSYTGLKLHITSANLYSVLFEVATSTGGH